MNETRREIWKFIKLFLLLAAAPECEHRARSLKSTMKSPRHGTRKSSSQEDNFVIIRKWKCCERFNSRVFCSTFFLLLPPSSAAVDLLKYSWKVIIATIFMLIRKIIFFQFHYFLRSLCGCLRRVCFFAHNSWRALRQGEHKVWVSCDFNYSTYFLLLVSFFSSPATMFGWKRRATFFSARSSGDTNWCWRDGRGIEC